MTSFFEVFTSFLSLLCIEAMESEEDLVSVIQLLNGGNHEQVGAANSLLMQFIETEMAWIWCLKMLRNSDQFVQYFAANMLLTKAKKHWNFLSPLQQNEVFEDLVAFIQEYAAASERIASSDAYSGNIMSYMKTYVNRFSQILAVICCQYEPKNEMGATLSGIGLFVKLGNDMLKSSMQIESDINSPPILPPSASLVSLDLLAVLPNVIDEVDISRATRIQLNDQLIALSNSIYECTEQLINSRGDGFTSNEIISVLRLLKSWGTASGITLSNLAEKYHSIFVFVLGCVRSASDPLCLCEASLCVHSLVNVNEYPRPVLRNSAVSMIMQAWAGSNVDNDELQIGVCEFDNPGLKFLLQNVDMDETAVNSICQSIIQVAFCELDFIVSEDGFYPPFVSLLFTLTNLRPRVISLHSFEFWIALEDSDINHRHDYFCREVFHTLTFSLLNQLIYPEDESVSSWGVGMSAIGCDDSGSDTENGQYDEGVNDMMEYRKSDQGIQDVLKLCIDSIGSEEFFSLINTYTTNAFVLYGENVGIDSSVQEAGPADWRTLDVVMYVFVRVMDVLRQDAVNHVDQSYVPSSINILLKVLEYILLPIHSAAYVPGNQFNQQFYLNLPTPFFITTCGLLGAATFLLSPPTVGQYSPTPPSNISPHILSPFQQLFSMAIEFFFFSMSSLHGVREVAHSAADGLLRLTTHGIHNIINLRDEQAPSSDVLRAIINSTAVLVSSVRDVNNARKVPLKSLLLVLQSVTVLISSYPSQTHRTELLTAIVDPVVSQMELNLTATTACDASDFIRSLQIVAQIIRYINPLSSIDSVDNMDYVVSFLGTIWPLLERIVTAMNTLEESVGAPVLDCVFSIYRNTVANIPTLLAQQPGVLQDMAQTCLTSFFSTRNCAAIDCATAIIEAYPTSSSSTSTEDTFVLSGQILQHSMDAMCGDGYLDTILGELMTASSTGYENLERVKMHVRERWSFGGDPEAMEHFFCFLYQFFLSSPHIVLHFATQCNGTGDSTEKTFSVVDGLMQLLLVSLYVFRERDTVRKIYSVLQAILIPVVGGDALDSQQHNNLIMLPSLKYSEIFLQLTFELLDPFQQTTIERDSNGSMLASGGSGLGTGQQFVQTGILPSLSETLYSLLVVCDENGISDAADWLTCNLVSQVERRALLLPSIAASAPERNIICDAMLHIAHSRTGRKFKTLISDVQKVCTGEMDVTMLRDYCV